MAGAARQLVGVPFRLHGRDPETGLDCLGLVGAAMASAGFAPVLPTGYGLRNREIAQYIAFAHRNRLESTGTQPRQGDIVHYALAGAQHHLGIWLGENRIVHAHAGLGRVVEGVVDPSWRIANTWRVPASPEI